MAELTKAKRFVLVEVDVECESGTDPDDICYESGVLQADKEDGAITATKVLEVYTTRPAY